MLSLTPSTLTEAHLQELMYEPMPCKCAMTYQCQL